jgi:formate C-acetyltransferase
MTAPVLETDAPARAGFAGERWRETIDVRDFVQANYAPYHGGGFLFGPTARTSALWARRHGRRAGPPSPPAPTP